MIKYPSIGQFRNSVKNVIDHVQYTGKDDDGLPKFDRHVDLPSLWFKGTPKIHGTNASIVYFPNGNIVTQSRNRVLSVEKDNHGFANFVVSLPPELFEAFPKRDVPIVVYGEWCGGSIQKGSSMAGLDKYFVVFDVWKGDEENGHWVSEDDVLKYFDAEILNHYNIYHIEQFPSYMLEINFNKPQMHQNELVYLTEQIESECPIAKVFGVDNAVGEGVVWKCVDEGFEDSKFWFKVKGEKHSVSKVKTLAEVDVEKLQSIEDFCDRVITENRLVQGIEYLTEMGLEPSQKTTGPFLSWVFADVMKEEIDVLEDSGLDKKDVSKSLGTRARKWYFDYLDSEAFNE